MKRYAYAWLTAGFFLVSIGLHWLFGWYAFVDEQKAHGQSVQVAAYLMEMGRDTFENWQSEFLRSYGRSWDWPTSSMSAPRPRRRTTTASRRRSTPCSDLSTASVARR